MGVIDRAKNIIVQPKAEWSVIDTEPDTVGGLYTRYIIPLSLLQVGAWLIGAVLFGQSIAFITTIHTTTTGTLVAIACGSLIASLVLVYLVAFVVDGLAPTFGGTKNSIQALKVSAYSFTAYWVFGLLSIVPPIGWIGFFLGFYSFYLLYLGLPALMKSPAEKTFGYAVVTVVVGIVLFFLVRLLLGILGLGAGYAMR